MAKEPWYYQTTPSKWAAAQARGYLLETTVTPMSSNPVHIANNVKSWTQLSKGHIRTINRSEGAGVNCSILLKVMYERKATDFVSFHTNVGSTVCATGQIPLSDVEVLSTTYGESGSGSGS